MAITFAKNDDDAIDKPSVNRVPPTVGTKTEIDERKKQNPKLTTPDYTPDEVEASKDHDITKEQGFDAISGGSDRNQFSKLFDSVISHRSFAHFIKFIRLQGIVMNATYFRAVTDLTGQAHTHVETDAVSQSGVDGKYYDILYSFPVVAQGGLQFEQGDFNARDFTLELAVLPETIIPNVGDYIVLEKMPHFLFQIDNTLEPHNAHSLSYYKISLNAITDTFNLDEVYHRTSRFYNKIRDSYTTIYANIGTDSAYLLKDNAGICYKKLDTLIKDMVINYCGTFCLNDGDIPALLVPERYNEISFNKETYETMSFLLNRKILDPYLLNFIDETAIFNNNEGAIELGLNGKGNIDEYRYRRTIYGYVDQRSTYKSNEILTSIFVKRPRGTPVNMVYDSKKITNTRMPTWMCRYDILDYSEDETLYADARGKWTATKTITAADGKVFLENLGDIVDKEIIDKLNAQVFKMDVNPAELSGIKYKLGDNLDIDYSFEAMSENDGSDAHFEYEYGFNTQLSAHCKGFKGFWNLMLNSPVGIEEYDIKHIEDMKDVLIAYQTVVNTFIHDPEMIFRKDGRYHLTKLLNSGMDWVNLRPIFLHNKNNRINAGIETTPLIVNYFMIPILIHIFKIWKYELEMLK